MIRQFLPAATLALTCTLLAGTALADTNGAQTFVEKEHGNIKKLVDTNAPSDQVRRAIDGMVDYDELARRTMGKPCPAAVPQCTNHWDKDLDDGKRKEFTELLRKLVEKNYHKNLNRTRDYDITYRGAKDAGEQNLAKVRTEAESKAKPRDPAVQVDYVIMGQGDRYKVIDIVTEGSSMSKNYYDQCHKMLITPGQGWPYLVQKFNEKIARNDTK
jgi:phospholipid transport system substrate-binding protein